VAQGEGRKWLKYGCLGCTGCLGLVLLVAAFVVATAWSRARSERVEERVLTHAPATPAAPANSETDRAQPTAPGRVVLDLSDAEFHIEPGRAGEPVHVEATFDENSFSLDEASEGAEGGPWTYRVGFRRTRPSSWWLDALQQAFSRGRPSVRVFLPPDVPIALEAGIQRGGAIVELGGLHLTSVDLDVSMGGLELSVGEPTREPIERFAAKLSMGGGEFRSLGNASPRQLGIEYSMGGMMLDLRGGWRTDSEITLRGSMGGAQVELPRDVRVEGVPDRTFPPPDNAEVPVPTLRFTTSSQMGEVEFD
jgi:hypothetical protein